MESFIPANALEQALLDARDGKVPPSRLFQALVDAQVFVMVSQSLGDNGEWLDGTRMLVLENDAGKPLVAVFSSPPRSLMWHDIAVGFGHGLLVDFRWVLGGVMDDVGIAVNPGSEVGVELAPNMVRKLRDGVPLQ